MKVFNRDNLPLILSITALVIAVLDVLTLLY
jgi:hypothetical protein